MAAKPIRQVVPVTTGTLEIKQSPFGELVNRETLGTKMSWDSKAYELINAFLSVSADQDILSGASLTINHNNRKLTPVIRWHAFETNDKNQIYNIGSTITNGENIFDFVFEVGGANRLGATCKVEASVTLEFKQLDSKSTDDTPAGTTKPDDKRTTEKALDWISVHLKLIAAIVIVGGIIGGISYLYLKKQNLLLSVFSRFRR